MFFKRIRINCLYLFPVLLSIGGCYSYKPLPRAIESNNYTTLVADDKFVLPGDDRVMDLEEAQEIAVRENPSLIAASHSMGAAWAVFYQSLTPYLPTSQGTFQIGSVNTYQGKYRGPFTRGPDTFTSGNSIALENQYLIFDGLVRTMNMLAAWNSAKESEEAVKDSHRLLRRAVTVAYNSILLTQENIRIAKADLDFNLIMLEETEIKYEAGAKALIDVLNFRIIATQSNNAMIEFEYLHRISKYVLARLMGLTDSTIPDYIEFPPIGDVQPEMLTDIAFYLDQALRNRPDLEEYRRRLNIAEYNLYARWGQLSPEVYFNNTLSHSEYRNRSRLGGESSISHLRQDQLYYGGTVQWTMFEGGRRLARIREAQALVVASEFDVAQQWLTVIKEVRQAYDECQKNAKLLILFQQIQKDSLRYRDLVEEDYKAGNAPITELNQAQSELTKNEALLVRSQINILNARAQLLAAIGAYSTIPEGLGKPEKK